MITDPPPSSSAIEAPFEQLTRFPEELKQSFLKRYGQLPCRIGDRGQYLQVLYHCSNTRIEHEHHFYLDDPLRVMGQLHKDPDSVFLLPNPSFGDILDRFHVQEQGRYVPQKLCPLCALWVQQGSLNVTEYRCARHDTTRYYLLAWRAMAQHLHWPTDGFAVICPQPREVCECGERADLIGEWPRSRRLAMQLAAWMAGLRQDYNNAWKWLDTSDAQALGREFNQVPLAFTGSNKPLWDAAQFRAYCPVLPVPNVQVAIARAVPELDSSMWFSMPHIEQYQDVMLKDWEWLGTALEESLRLGYTGALGD